MEARFSLGKITQDNLVECLHLHPAKMGAERIGKERAVAAWRKMLARAEVCKGATTIERIFRQERQIVGCGIAVFVKQSFAEREVTNPQPGLNLRVVESIDSGRSVLASHRELCDDNTRAELQQVVLYTDWRRQHLEPAEVAEVRGLLALSYQQLYAGYRMSRMLAELVDNMDLEAANDFPGVHVISRFQQFFAANPNTAWNTDRALAMTTGETLQRDPGSIAGGLFLLHRKPRFRFNPGEQELLEAALKGLDDLEASKELYRSFSAIKRRWITIFEKVDAALPGLCPPGEGPSRGPQKRYRVLAYMREHPEELRPFNHTKFQPEATKLHSAPAVQL